MIFPTTVIPVYQATLHHIPQDHGPVILHHRNLKSLFYASSRMWASTQIYQKNIKYLSTNEVSFVNENLCLHPILKCEEQGSTSSE